MGYYILKTPLEILDILKKQIIRREKQVIYVFLEQINGNASREEEAVNIYL